MGLLDTIDNLLGTRLGLLVNDPRAAIGQMNQQAGAFNQASLLAVQAERNAINGRPSTPEQLAAKQMVDNYTRDLAMGFAGSTSLPKPLNNPLNTLERMSPWFIKYPKAADIVDGLRVGESVKNQSSIPASFSKYEIEKGIKSVPISDFKSNPTDLFRSADDLKRVNELAKQIKENKYIDPLIVAVDNQGSYILEGGHRLGALNLLGIKNFPAMVVRDLDY